MSKKKRKPRQPVTEENHENKAERKQAILKLLELILAITLIFGFYRLMLNFRIFIFVFIAYLVIFAGFIIAYLIYNRGMSRKGVTEEMLPEEWSDEQKREYIEDGERRLKKSSWMLMVMIGFIFTFSFDLLELYVLPLLERWLS